MSASRRFGNALFVSLIGSLVLAGCNDTTRPSLEPQEVRHEATTIVDYEASEGEFPEGIAVGKRGNVFVTLPELGTVERISRDGSRTRMLDTPLDAGVGLGLLGLAVDARGNVYAAFFSADPLDSGADPGGVYRIGRNGEARHLPGTEAIAFPNALAFDPRGSLYVTDTLLGAVWRIDRDGTVDLWLQDARLEGTGALEQGFPLGANGIAYHHDVLYVAVTEKGHIVRIPVASDGSAGAPDILVADPALVGIDGLTLDVHGDIYVVNVLTNALLRVEADGGDVNVVPAAGLDGPASLAFGTGSGDRQSVMITNYAIVSRTDAGVPPDPGVVRIEVGVPGLPLP